MAAAGIASAQTFVWTGGGGSNQDVTTAANWQGGVAPGGLTGLEDFVLSAAGNFSPRFTTAFAVRNLDFSSGAGFYNFTYLPAAGTLTLNGDITLSSAARNAILFGVPLTLSSGTHLLSQGSIEVGSGDVYFFSQIDGAGGFAKYGRGSAIFDHSGNTFSGGIDIEEGRVVVHGDGALGTGTINLGGGGGTLVAADYYDDNHLTVLTNDLIVGENSYFGDGYGKGSLTITGTTTANGGLYLNTSNLHVSGYGQLTLNSLGETDPGTNFAFSDGGFVRIGGAATYTGNTYVTDGTTVVFANGPPILAASLSNDYGAYIGTETTSNIQSHFINSFNPAQTYGTLGFDSPNSLAPQSFNEDLDFSGLNSSVSYGTSTAAILTGNITPYGNNYNFGGRGVLTVTSALTGSGYGLTSDFGLLLILQGTDLYDGVTQANDGSGIIFDGYYSIPGSSAFSLGYSGYIGQTEAASISAASFLAMFDTGTDGVIGFDSHDLNSPRVVSETIDLTNFYGNVFIGTATLATLNGTIIPGSNGYAFTGFRDGRLTVDSQLTGSNSVTIGLDSESIFPDRQPTGADFHPSVTLNASNTYTGSTYLQSGDLILGNNQALGTNTVYVSMYSTGGKLSTNTDGLVIGNAFELGGSYSFQLGGAHDYTLSGNWTADGADLQKVDANTITFTGDNSGLNLYDFTVAAGALIFTTDTAAGHADFYLQNSDTVDAHLGFTSAAPSIGSLGGDDRTTVDLGSGNLTIDQSYDDTFSGVISGTGGITKTGDGTLTLSNANTYSGVTQLVQGTIVAANNQALGTGTVLFNGGRLSVLAGVTINNPISFTGIGSTLGGNGTFGGAVSVGTDVQLAPGNSVGLLSFTGGLTWAPGGSYEVEVQVASGARGSGYDSIDVTGGLTLTATSGSPFVLYLTSLDPSGNGGAVGDFDSMNGYAWLIAHSDNLVGFNASNIVIDTGNFVNDLGVGGFYVTASGNDVYLNFSPVPEPSTWVLLAGGLGTCLIPVWRRRRRV